MNIRLLLYFTGIQVASVLAHADAVTNAFIVGTTYDDIAYIQGSGNIGTPVLSTNSAWYYYKTNTLLWWPFSDAQSPTTIPDWSENSKHGTVLAGINPIPNCHTADCYRISSIYENALRSAVSGIGSNSTELTVAVWFYLYPGAISNTPMLATSYYSGQRVPMTLLFASEPIRMYVDSISSPYNGAYSDAAGNLVAAFTATGSSSATNWHRMVMTYIKRGGSGSSGGQITCYLDGSVIASTAAINLFPATGYWACGLPVGNIANAPDMLIDDFVIDAHFWNTSRASNDFALGRSRTLILP